MHGPPAHCHCHHWNLSHYFLRRSTIPWTTRTSRLPWFEGAHLCAFCHNLCYSGVCVEPTSQPSHPVATFKPSGRSPTWVAVTITYLQHCFAFGAGSVLGVCDYRFSVVAAHSLQPFCSWCLHTGTGCGVPRHQLFGRFAQCVSAADYLDLVTHVAARRGGAGSEQLTAGSAGVLVGRWPALLQDW